MKRKDTQPEKEPQLVIPYGYTPYNQPEEDEVDLRELWHTLKKRKKTVLATTAIVFAIAVAYIFFAKPLYEAKATVVIGKQLVKTSGGVVEKYFENAKTLKQILDVRFDTAKKYRDENMTAYIENVTVPKKSAGFIIITANAPSNEEATNMLKQPIDIIFKRHQTFYDTILDIKKNQVDALMKQLDYLKTAERQKLQKELDLSRSIDLKKIESKIALIKNGEIPSIEKKIEASKKDISEKEKNISDMQSKLMITAKQDPTLAAMVAMQISNLQNDIAHLSKKIIDYQMTIEKLLKETIPDLEKEKKIILEKVIPAKEAAIKELESITIPKLSAQIEEIEASMKPPYLQKTQLVGKIYTHDYPVKPKKKLILAIALITGLFLGIFLAFFFEFIAKNENRER